MRAAPRAAATLTVKRGQNPSVGETTEGQSALLILLKIYCLPR
jgi:hypothetical protein